jgi:hypothetical protein
MYSIRNVTYERRNIKIRHTCSNFKKHCHRWYWSAWLCGRLQKFLHKYRLWTPKDLKGNPVEYEAS